MKILRLSIFLLFLGSCSAFAGELDSYYLQQFGELTTDSAKAVLKSAQTPTLHKCGMPLQHGLKRDWQQLEAGTQKTLAKYLAKPTDIEYPNKLTSKGNHFVIHYKSIGLDAPSLADNDQNGIPDWIETVAAVFEAVYDKEVTAMQYRTPPNVPYDVYLRTLTSFLGLTTSDIVTGRSATSFIEIDKDFQNFSISFNPYTPLDLLKITAAHEFHHAIQYGYNFFFEPWYAETTATWMEDEVYDSVNQLYDYVPAWFRNTNRSIDKFIDSGDTGQNLTFGYGYGRWIFNRSVTERLTASTVRETWETLGNKLPAGNADIPMTPVLEEVMLKHGSSLGTEFSEFAKRVYTRNWQSHTDGIILLPNYTPITTYSSYPVNGSSLPTPSLTLPAYSFGYYKFSPSSSAPTNLNFTFSPSGNFSITAFKKTTGGVVTEFPLTTVGGNLTIDSFNVPGVTEIAVLVCNKSPVSATVSFSTDGTIPVAPPIVSGSSNRCFIATAAYGSYLHPEVVTLRDFRDRYLLTNLPGRAFVSFYYRLSPPIADFISEHESARLIVRVLLAPIIFAVKHLAAVLAAAVILSLLACSRLWKRSATKTATVTESS